MSPIETVTGTVTALTRRETASGVMLQFSLALQRGASRRAQWTAPEADLHEGDLVAVSGTADSNGVLVVQAIGPVPAAAPEPRLPRWLFLILPAVILTAQWAVEEYAEGGISFWDMTERFIESVLGISGPVRFRATLDDGNWVLWLLFAVGLYAVATKKIRNPIIRLPVRIWAVAAAVTAIAAALNLWDLLLWIRLLLIVASIGCIAYLIYVNWRERKRKAAQKR